MGVFMSSIIARVNQSGMQPNYQKHLVGDKLAFIEELSQLITNLDASISEVIRKKSINYQVNGKNFAAIDPWASKVVVAPLHLKFNQVPDPKRICRDISKKTYGLSNSQPDEIRMDFQGHNLRNAAYAIPFINQSLEGVLKRT